MAKGTTEAQSGVDVTGAADSQAQTVSAEPSQRDTKVENIVAKTGSTLSGEDTGYQFFDGTIVKIDSEGRDVMSDHLAPGEKLRRSTTTRYAAAKTAERREANEQQ